MGQRDFDIDPIDLVSLETKKLSGKRNYGRVKFDLSLILLALLTVCTAYVLAKLP